ncbi:MAG: type I polyketide synthase, partial [Planctomycetia bacterium]
AWHAERPIDSAATLAAAFVARDGDELRRWIAGVQTEDGARKSERPTPGDRVFLTRRGLLAAGGRPGAPQPGLAFVFPGSGNHYPGMGRRVSAEWPEVPRRQDVENGLLREHYRADLMWNIREAEELDRHAHELLCAQVSMGTLAADLLAAWGVKPTAVVGNSLGESTSLFALRAWRDRDRMSRRMRVADVFQRDLGGERRALRRAWNAAPGVEVDWLVGVVGKPADLVRRTIDAVFPDEPTRRVHLLIVNTPTECVLGGDPAAVEAVVAALGVRFHGVRGLTVAHCPTVELVADAYRAIHHLPTEAPAGMTWYSGGWGRRYAVTADSAADAVAAQALGTIDFPRVVEAAYADGARVFLEVGPGASCTRMIGRILDGRPMAARATFTRSADETSTLLRAAAWLIAERASVNLDALYGLPTRCVGHRSPATAKPAVAVVTCGRPAPVLPTPRRPATHPPMEAPTETPGLFAAARQWAGA